MKWNILKKYHLVEKHRTGLFPLNYKLKEFPSESITGMRYAEWETWYVSLALLSIPAAYPDFTRFPHYGGDTILLASSSAKGIQTVIDTRRYS